MRKLLRIVAPALALASTAASPRGAMAQEVTFTKLLDSETPIPGEHDTFGPFGVPDDEPLIAMDSDGNLAFAAGCRVFAIIDGQLHHTRAPACEDQTQVAIDGGLVAFGVLDDGGARGGGIFRWEPGTAPIQVAGARTLVPGSEDCVFWTGEDGVSWWRFSLDGDAILFFGRGSDDSGSSCSDLKGTFLWWNGSIEHLADVSVASENGPGRASVDGGLIAFWRDGVIYAREFGEATARIVGPGDAVPGRSAVFDAVGGVAVAEGRVAFGGRDEAGRWGMYLWDGGTLSVLAEQGTELPGDRSLGYLQGFRLGPDRFAVIGSSSQGQLLYLKSLERGWEKVIDESCCGRVSEFAGRQLALSGVHVVRPDGSLLKVLQRGDMLDGRQVAAVFPGDLGANELALVIWFEGSTVDHLYVAQLPPIAVDIDVKPRHATNRVHPRSRRSIPVAILGSETFYVQDVDLATLGLGPEAAPVVGRAKLRDVNRDGLNDLVVRFRPRETGIAAGETEACLSGAMEDGIEFEGCASVRTRGERAAASR